MKAQNKAHGVFISKLGAILSKFKQSSTVHVGHQQLKTFFNQYSLGNIIIPFLTKMDTSDQLSDREKKQYTKVYISLAECFKEQILMDQFFQRIMESLNKKPMGVSQVISFICKTLLNRIQDPENLYPYISIILHTLRNHPQVPKIVKQVIEIIDSNVIASLQQQIMTVLHDRVNNAKSKHQFLDAILSLVLNLQQKLTVLPQVHNFLTKYIKSEDWNCRKICVDIGNALLIINHEISPNIHAVIKELKYDKIKHVRDSVNNYQVLYKQTYGEEIVEKPIKHYSSFREAKVKAQRDRKTAKSPVPIKNKPTPSEKPSRENDNSVQRQSKSKSKSKTKNANFFKNAKNSDVIKISQQNQSCIILDKQREAKVPKEQSFSVEIPEIKRTLQMVNEKASNFEAYLKNRNSPKDQFSSPKISGAGKRQLNSGSSKGEQKMVQKFNYEAQFQIFKKKNKPVDSQSHKNFKEQSSSQIYSQSMRQGSQELSMSFAEANNHPFFEAVTALFKQFQGKVMDRLQRMQERIQNLQRERNQQPQSSRMLKARVVSTLEPQSYKISSPKSVYYNQTLNQSSWQQSLCQGVESNLQDKVKASIINENWDEAFTLALTNNKKKILLHLLERCIFPSDKTVEECILLEIKKLTGYTSALKWLKYYLIQKQMSSGKLLKLKEQILKRTQGDTKNYEMMRQLVLHQIQQKLQSLN